MRRAAFISRWPLLLPAVLAVVVYAQVVGFAFVNLDDDIYVTGNPLLDPETSAAAALTSDHAEVWVPATWLSLRLDRALFGPTAAGFHFTNLLLHVVNVLLAGLLLERVLGGRWAVVLAAALFAVHPLGAEAVSWVTARKDLLAGAFALGAVVVHVGGRPGAARQTATVLLAVLAMAAKPAAVVVPVWLVLTDLLLALRDERPAADALRRAWPAKLLALLAGGAVAAVTVRLARGDEYGTGAAFGLVERCGQAAWMVLAWLGRLVWPTGLAPVYPPAAWEQPALLLAMSAVVVAAVTVGAVLLARARPLVAWGWLWFLVGVAPAAGIVRGGQLLMSDRYLYLPLIGLAALLVGSGHRFIARHRPGALRPAAAALALLVGVLAFLAHGQARHWRTPLDLWAHTLAVTTDNATAHTNYAVVLDEVGRTEEALAHLETSLRIAPHSLAHFNAANILHRLGRADEALVHYREARRRNPERREFALNLGAVLAETGRTVEALQVLEDARDRWPDDASVHYNLGLVHWLRGDRAAALAAWRRTVRLEPGHAGARQMLGHAQAPEEG